MTAITPGERFDDADSFASEIDGGEHIWTTLGYRRTAWEPGLTTVAWEATPAYCFPTAGGPIVQGGLVTALLDAAMGGACWTVLDRDQAFLTADLRVEFLRPSRVGLLAATGTVVRRTRRVVFCAGELHDASGELLATSRCTQAVVGGRGSAGRYEPDGSGAGDGAPPEDGRG